MIQTNFTGGEISPRMLGRSDLAKYVNSCQTVENFIVQKHGGLIRRPGTRQIVEVKTSSLLTILIEFQFSLTQTYILEFGNLYIRFLRDEAQLIETGTTPTEIVSPYTTAQLRDIQFIQSADILYLTHPSHEPRELRRTSGDDSLPATWSLVEFDSVDGPYLPNNTTDHTMNPSALSGSITVILSDIAAINDGQGFLTTDVGRLLAIEGGTEWGWGTITAHTSNVEVTVVLVDPIVNSSNPTTKWKIGAWSDSEGWPHCATFHQSRLWFGATNKQPQTLWGSVVGDFTNFRPFEPDETVNPDDALNVTLSTDRVDTIRNLVSDAEGLLILTEGGTFIGRSAGGGSDPIEPTNFGFARQHTFGAHDKVQPHKVGSVVLYVTSDGRKVREQVFRFEDNRFVSPDMTLLAEHITIGGLVDSAYMQEPDSIFWAVRADGQLLGLTYERGEKVVGWHRHILGGSLTGSDHAKVDSIAVIRQDNDDQLWMVVERTIDGVTRRYIEFMETRYGLNTDIEDAFVVDSGLTYDGVAATLISNLDHLEGETVDILADGAKIASQVVTGGSILLANAASVVQVGLGYTAKFKTMPLVPTPVGYDPRGKLKRIYNVALDLHNTMGGRIGTDSQLDEIVYRMPIDPMDAPPPLFTGIHERMFPGSWDRIPTVTVDHNVPQPMTVLNLIAEIAIGGV